MLDLLNSGCSIGEEFSEKIPFLVKATIAYQNILLSRLKYIIPLFFNLFIYFYNVTSIVGLHANYLCEKKLNKVFQAPDKFK